MQFNISDNFSRGDTFGTFARLLTIVHSMGAHGFHPTRPITVTDQTADYNGSAHDVLDDMVESHDWGEDGERKIAFRFVEGEGADSKNRLLKLGKDDIQDAIRKHRKAVMDEADAREPIDGNRRALAYTLASAVGYDLVPVVNVAEGDKRALNLGGNTLDTLGKERLQTAQEISAVVALVKDGTYKRQSDIPQKRGKQQSLWWQAQACILQGLEPEQAARLDYKSAKAVSEAKDQDAVVAIMKEADEARQNKPKMVKRSEIEDALKTATNDAVKAALTAILSDDPVGLKVAARKD